MAMIETMSAKETTQAEALKTLADITRYVTVNRFNLAGLARGLGRMGQSAELHNQLGWLVAHGYLTKDVSSAYSLTMEGRRYSPSETDDIDAPAIEFITPPDPPAPLRRNPRDRR